MSIHCMLTGGPCSHEIIVKSNSFFIAEPYDKNREPREKSILKAIDGFPYCIADEDIMNIALTCKVCREIQSSQFGIVELTSFNENVLIELGMMYGFGKPVILLIKKDANKPKIKIPSNIIGIEQVRYNDFSDLSIKLKRAISKLLEFSKMQILKLLDIREAIRHYLKNLEIQIDSKKLEEMNFEATITDNPTMGSSRIIVINKGELDGVKVGMLFKVFSTELVSESSQKIEQLIGIIRVNHIQKTISQAEPARIFSYEAFWNKASIGKSIPDNVIRPYIFEEFVDVSVKALEEQRTEMVEIGRLLNYRMWDYG